MLKSYRIFFMAKAVECQIIVKAKNYEEAKDQLFELVKDKNLSGLYYKSLDSDDLRDAESYIKENRICREDIKRTQKLENDEWI